MTSRQTFDTVRQIVMSWDGVEEGKSYGTPAFRVRGVLFVRLRDDIGALVVRVEIDRRQEMIDADPETYFLTDHYLNYPWILVRLSKVRRDSLEDLLSEACKLARSSKSKRTK